MKSFVGFVQKTSVGYWVTNETIENISYQWTTSIQEIEKTAGVLGKCSSFNIFNVGKCYDYYSDEDIELNAKGRILPDISIVESGLSRGKNIHENSAEIN